MRLLFATWFGFSTPSVAEKRASYPELTLIYTYDRVGNRLDGGRTYDAANQVISWTYDAAGNLLNDGSTAYTYDALHRAVTTAGTANVYNADGVLVQQGTTRYTQDLASPLSQMLGDGTSTYVYGQERLFALTGSSRTWYAAAALSSVRQTLDTSGAVLGNLAGACPERSEGIRGAR